jgi:hypothetical protein
VQGEIYGDLKKNRGTYNKGTKKKNELLDLPILTYPSNIKSGPENPSNYIP